MNDESTQHLLRGQDAIDVVSLNEILDLDKLSL